MCLHDALWSLSISLICNITTFRKICVNFDLTQGSRVFIRTEYLRACYCIRIAFNLIVQLNMF